MAVEMFSWPSLHERMCRTWGSNSGPLACQANTFPIAPGFSYSISVLNHTSLFRHIMFNFFKAPSNLSRNIPSRVFCCGLFLLSLLTFFVCFLFILDLLFTLFRTAWWPFAGMAFRLCCFNPYKPSVPVLEHMQTVQTQINAASDQGLHSLLTGIYIRNRIKTKKIHQTPLIFEMDSSSW